MVLKKDVSCSKVYVFWGDERGEKNEQESSFQLAFRPWLKEVEANVLVDEAGASRISS